MIKIGITGNIATGKSLIEGFLKEADIPVIDADKIVHDLYSQDSFIKTISDEFKNENIFENGILSRKKIGKIVFDDKNKLKKLENILHPQVIKEINSFFEINKGKKVAAASVPLLFETKMEKLFDCIITVFTDEKTQLARLMTRNNFTKEEALKRINSQMSQSKKVERADFSIDNSDTKENTKKQLLAILEKIC